MQIALLVIARELWEASTIHAKVVCRRQPSPTSCENAFLAFDGTGLNPTRVTSATAPSGIAAGSGNLFSGTNPVTISNNIAAGNAAIVAFKAPQ
jgi:hypothetical protein